MQGASPRDQIKRVQGPISAMVLQLLRVDWQPMSPSAWSYQGDKGTTEEWQFPDHIYTGNKWLDTHAPLVADIRHTARRRLWQHVEAHYCGSGLAGGVDSESYRLLLKQLGAQDPRLEEVMLNIATGAFWPTLRKK
eukprot:3686904-Pyramimonas_sp.AAC.1